MSPPAVHRDHDRSVAGPPRFLPPGPARVMLRLGLLALQPLFARIIHRIAARYPEVLERLGPHTATRFVIEPIDLPFAVFMRPAPGALVLRAVPRADLPEHDTRIAGKFLRLVRLIDCDEDGDAMFFARDLEISGDTEAIVTLRNALDNIDGSIAASVAELFGPPGRAGLAALRRFGGWQPREGLEHA